MEFLSQYADSIDALPYVDPPMSKDTEVTVQRLIQEEMRRFSPNPNYLAKFGKAPSTANFDVRPNAI